MRFFFLRAALLGVAFTAAPTLAHEFKAGAIAIDHPFARATTSSMSNGAAYMVLANQGTSGDRLLSASAPTVAAAVELHMNIKKGTVVEMHHVTALDLPAGARADLSPAGTYHLMLMGLKQPLKLGTSFPMTLVFEKAGTVEVSVTVERAGSSGPKAGQHH